MIDSPTSDERISLITDIFSDRHETEVAKFLSGDDAQSFVDVVVEVLFLLFRLEEQGINVELSHLTEKSLDMVAPKLQKKCLAALRKICGRQALLPRSAKIAQISELSGVRLGGSGYANVWKSQRQDCNVVVKVLKPSVHSTRDFERIMSVGAGCRRFFTFELMPSVRGFARRS